MLDDEITVLEGWAGDEYGIPVESTGEAMFLTGRLEGVILDPVYEGKSMAGLISLVARGDIPKDSHVLYAHLGGQTLLPFSLHSGEDRRCGFGRRRPASAVGTPSGRISWQS